MRWRRRRGWRRYLKYSGRRSQRRQRFMRSSRARDRRAWSIRAYQSLWDRCRPDPVVASGRARAGLPSPAEWPGGLLLGVAVDDQVQALVVGRKVSLDRGDLLERRLVVPEQAGMPMPVEH